MENDIIIELDNTEQVFDGIETIEEITTTEYIDYTNQFIELDNQLTELNNSVVILNNTLHIFFVVFLLFAVLSRFKIRGDD